MRSSKLSLKHLTRVACFSYSQVTSPFSSVSDIYLPPTPTIDSDHSEIRRFAAETVRGLVDPIAKAVALYYAVRDLIFYDPFIKNLTKENFKASVCLQSKRSFCIPKAILLAALARAEGIPSRLGFADVTNHLSSEKLRAMMKTDIFSFHGYTELFLDGKWVKATPAFNARLCRLYKIKPLEFDGKNDSIFHPYSEDGKKYMEYIHDHGTFADMPFDQMIAAFRKHYPHWFGKNALLENYEAGETATPKTY